MFCVGCGAAMADDAKFCARCGRAAGPAVQMSGGAFFAGSVSAGRNVIGEVRGDYTDGDPEAFGRLFRDVYASIDAAGRPGAEAEALRESARQVEQEIARGEAADPGTVEKALSTIAELAPRVLEIAVNAITNPAAAVASAVRLVAERFRR